MQVSPLCVDVYIGVLQKITPRKQLKGMIETTHNFLSTSLFEVFQNHIKYEKQ